MAKKVSKVGKPRYDRIECLLSPETKAGMHLTIDDLLAIGRLLSLQDVIYEEMIEKMNDRINCLEKKFDEKIEDHEKRLIAVEDILKIRA